MTEKEVVGLHRDERPTLELPDVEAADPERTATSEQGAQPQRICPECSTITATEGDFCPHCGASYVRGTGRRLPRKKLLMALLVLLLVCGGVSGALVKRHHDAQVRAEKKAAQQKRQQAEAAAAAAALKAAEDEAERSHRAELVSGLEDSVTKDANKRIKDGFLDGPRVTSTSCTPLGGGSVDDLTALTGEFTCIAINKTQADGTSEGYRFTGTVNYDTDQWSWHLG